MKKITGFTFIELVITVAIVGILAAIAYPMYTDQIRKARRADAKNSLLGLQVDQEKYRANNPTYAASFNELYGGGGGASQDSSDGYYTISITANTATTFGATATPKTGTDQADDDCGTFAINQSGPYYSGYAPASCWNR